MNPGLAIVGWFQHHGRVLPFRQTSDPYKIWVAEIVFQQTRIQQGLGHYLNFVRLFPDVQTLAAAAEPDVMKAWEGLGYYSRARNLHAAAQYVVNTLGGQFPQHFSGWLALKGVGEYTARAVGAFAFGNETGVVDGNVMRVVSRYTGDFAPVDDLKTRARIQTVVDEWVKGQPPGDFNNGMMDIGATICTPTKPGCMLCPLAEGCYARNEGATHLLPVKAGKIKRSERWFHFWLVRNAAGQLAIRRRPADGFWGGLYEIPNTEQPQDEWKQRPGPKPATTFKHVFTHFDMHIAVYPVGEGEISAAEDWQWIDTEEIEKYAFSKAVLKIFDKLKIKNI